MFDDFVHSSNAQPSASSSSSAQLRTRPSAGATDVDHVFPRNGPRPTSPSARLHGSAAHRLHYDALADDGGGYEQQQPHMPNRYLATNAILDPVAALETGFISSDLDPSSSQSPIFQLGRVQYAFNAPLALMTVASNILTMCLFAYPSSSSSSHHNLGAAPATNPFPSAPPRLVRINLDDPERTQEADVPIPPAPRAARNQQPQDPTTIGPHKMFADPSGTHLILTMRNGDCYYWATGWRKARLLNKLKGVLIESVAWNKSTLDPVAPAAASGQGARKRGGAASGALASTREILVGTRSGDILEVVISAPVGADPDEGDFFDKLARRTAGGGGDRGDIDKVVRHVFTLPERQPVTGLTAEPFPRSAQGNGNNNNNNNGSAGPPPPAGKRRGGGGSAQRAVVIATTSTRIYEFVGQLGKLKGDESESESLYEKLFEPYRGDAVPNLKSELPGDLPYSELHTWTASGSREASALAWLTGPGVYHGLIAYNDQGVGDSVIDSANLLPYPAIALDVDHSGRGGGGGGGNGTGTGNGNGAGAGAGQQTVAEIPLSIALTEFHFVLLYQDRVMAISSLDDQVIFEEALPLRPDERVIGTAVDVAKRTFWVYTDASIFELVVRDESRDVWRIYLERGSFDAALRYAKAGVQRGTVLSSQGDRFFAEARYIQAAQCYAQTFMRSFEEVSLRFVESGQRDALRYYLVMRLERLRRSDGPQRTMLATWLVEIYLGKINQLEDVAAAEAASQDVENYRLEREMLAEELHQFLATYRDALHPATTYGIIQKHGRSEVLLHYAGLIGDFDRIVRHHVQEEAWTAAIDTLQRQSSDDLYYRFATVLMRQAPRQVVECWKARRGLDPRRLIPALLQHRRRGRGKAETEAGAGEGGEDDKDYAIAYLTHVVSVDGNTDTAIHNLLLTLLARSAAFEGRGKVANGDGDGTRGDAGEQSPDKAALLGFIDSARSNPLTGQPYFDLDYALRTCSAHGQKEACVRIYAKMGLYESAVDLAIAEREMELACSCADLVDGDKDLKKKLWLKIAKEVVRSTKDIKSAMEFLERTDQITLEDALPFFPDFVIIDDCKAAICSALESYASHIETLKDEMEEASRSAAAISADIAALSSRFVSVEAEQRCESCGRVAVERQFYIFPCRHALHVDCLVAVVTRGMGGAKLRRLVDLQANLASGGGAAANSRSANGGGGGGGNGNGGGGSGGPSRSLGLDKLRDIVSPETILSLLSTGVSAGVAGGRRALAPLDPFSTPTAASTWVTPRQSLIHPSSSSIPAAGAGAALTTTTTTTMTTATRKEEEETRSSLMAQLDGLIAAECPLCSAAVGDIARPFVAKGEEEEWAL
ncbi:uncharacterized protein PFL1_05448 [Pseudozyma flocculosa PF-1]|uniref:Related to DigA protein n=2 Tax=Pseudozyma flocculosa TaxID=84751 RepID=A0A5C3FC98_9BASI|nr:uncharacterized protein PFL1_05448 [Pseudozyma flocculosa PF-1]EPQ27167.1 hypothetical protein PFL1_05448 [Pseudozyma flocculosa PF-1]SPO41247.1 related to DigA protein [Pseudozyma flocculosa]